jgi:hypothetical protein
MGSILSRLLTVVVGLAGSAVASYFLWVSRKCWLNFQSRHLRNTQRSRLKVAMERLQVGMVLPPQMRTVPRLLMATVLPLPTHMERQLARRLPPKNPRVSAGLGLDGADVCKFIWP